MTQATPEYMVVCRDDVGSLEGSVQSFLGMGWQPIGGVAVRVISMTSKFYQAMVKPSTSGTDKPSILSAAPEGVNAAQEKYCDDNPNRRLSDCLHCGEECQA